MFTRRLAALACLSLLAVTASACAVSSDDLADEEAATTSSALDTGLGAAELESLASSDLGKAARSIVADQGIGAKGDGCRTRTLDPQDDHVVHVKLVNCTGRFGRHVVNGEVTITFSANPDGSLHAEHVSQGLTIDGRPAERTVSADITIDGDLRRVTRAGVKTGTNARGDSFTKKTRETVLVDRASHCRTINGTGSAVFSDGRTVDSTIKDLKICEADRGVDLCPTGSVEHVNAAKGRSVTQRFDGSAVAAVEITTRRGNQSTSWDLTCAPAR